MNLNWIDPKQTPEDLVKLSKEDPRAYSNPNLPLVALLEGAESHPWYVEQNPALALFALEDPAMCEKISKALVTGWMAAGVRALSEPNQRLYACDCAERVLPTFEAKYPNDVRPRDAILVARRFALRQASRNALNAAADAAGSRHLVGVETFCRNALNAAADAAGAAARDATDSAYSAAHSAAQSAADDTADAAYYAPRYAVSVARATGGGKKEEQQWQANRVRDYYAREHPDYQRSEEHVRR